MATAEDNYMVRSFIICATRCIITLVSSRKMSEACSRQDRQKREIPTGFWLQRLKARDHLADLGLSDKI
jgi:hypothetical protein